MDLTPSFKVDDRCGIEFRWSETRGDQVNGLREASDFVRADEGRAVTILGGAADCPAVSPIVECPVVKPASRRGVCEQVRVVRSGGCERCET